MSNTSSAQSSTFSSAQEGLDPDEMETELGASLPGASEGREPEKTIQTPDTVEADASEEALLSAADLQATTSIEEELRREVESLKDRLLRTLAELENTRRRSEREKTEAALYATTGFARALLSVGDNLSRALGSIPQGEEEGLDAITKGLLEGVELTHRDLVAVFERHDIRMISAMGQKFDPHIHQAMFEIPDTAVPPGTVVQVLQEGYRIGERVLRPALVGVSKAEG